MKYQVFLLSDDETNTTMTEIGRIETAGPVPSLVTRLSGMIYQDMVAVTEAESPAGTPAAVRAGAHRGRPAKPLTLLAIEDPQIAPTGIKAGAIISSSMELSLLLGYNYNMVVQCYSKEKSKRDIELLKLPPAQRNIKKDEPIEMTLRGVTFCYTSELAGTKE